MTERTLRDRLKAHMDRLRAEASRGPLTSRELFALTDPIMDLIAPDREWPLDAHTAEQPAPDAVAEAAKVLPAGEA